MKTPDQTRKRSEATRNKIVSLYARGEIIKNIGIAVGLTANQVNITLSWIRANKPYLLRTRLDK